MPASTPQSVSDSAGQGYSYNKFLSDSNTADLGPQFENHCLWEFEVSHEKSEWCYLKIWTGFQPS